MKTFILATIVAFFTISGNAQQHDHSTSAPTEKANTRLSLSATLSSYYDIKNALVNGDATQAANKATAFAKALNAVDMNTIAATDMNVFMTAQQKLSASAAQLAKAKSIAEQRQSFASLSADLYSLATSVKLSDQPIYLQTCPMKKASWLSQEATVKNPYYGKQMLSCGNVTATLK